MTKKTEIARDAASVIGVLLILDGCYRVSEPLTLIAAGAVVLAGVLPWKKARR